MNMLLFAAAGVLAAAPSLRLESAVVTACQNGLGQLTLHWDSEGLAPVKLYAGEAAMSGDEAAAGSAATGPWVTDGMIFTLRDTAGRTLATARAALQCEAVGWWPLDVGNEWHFRVNSRSVTGAHAVWRIARKERIDGVDWAVLEPGPAGPERLRADANGRLYRLAADGKERLLFDATGVERGAWTPGGRVPNAVTLAGTFSEEVRWQGDVAGLGRESGRLARGVGPTYYQTDVIAGSSGGFGTGYTLLEAVVNGARFTPAYPRVELSVESQSVDLSTKSARNCAVPCYFVACFGADLPTTYKPCMEASVRGGTGRLALVDADGRAVFEVAAAPWVRIPLYREPATLLPAGRYRVEATVNGTTVAVPVEIR